MTSAEIMKQLDEMKKANREKEKAMRKELEKMKRRENDELTRNVGKLMRAAFPELTTIEDFKKLIDILAESTTKERAADEPEFLTKISEKESIEE